MSDHSDPSSIPHAVLVSYLQFMNSDLQFFDIRQWWRQFEVGLLILLLLPHLESQVCLQCILNHWSHASKVNTKNNLSVLRLSWLAIYDQSYVAEYKWKSLSRILCSSWEYWKSEALGLALQDWFQYSDCLVFILTNTCTRTLLNPPNSNGLHLAISLI